MLLVWSHLWHSLKSHMQTHHMSRAMVVHRLMICSTRWESESYTVCRRFRTSPSSHLLKRNKSPPQREGKIPANSCKGLHIQSLTHTHTENRDSDELYWENPCCTDPSKAKTCKALQAIASQHSKWACFPPVKGIRLNEKHWKVIQTLY